MKPSDHCRIASFAIALLLEAPQPASAAEGGLTNYLAGYYGDFAVAVAPTEGLYLYATAYQYTATSNGPDFNSDLHLDGFLKLVGFQYVLPNKFMGAQYAVAAYTTHIDADLSLTGVGTFSETAHGDSSISPLVLYWSFGNLHISLYESIILPTGRYERIAPLNTGRNYVSFDTVLALTWLDRSRGVELSIVPGLMINTRNDATDYKTGAEFHIDGMFNMYPSENFALGLHGYAYSQIESDDAPSTMSNGLRSSSYAFGPALLWIPPYTQGKLVAKWLHEVDSKNRFAGDIISVTLAVRF